MAKRRKKKGSGTEKALERLTQLKPQLPADGAVAEVIALLASSDAIVVTDAARLAEAHSISRATAPLVQAFDRFLVNGADSDPGCRAKLAIVEALQALHYPGAALFERAARHVQMEKAWGPPVDGATALRSTGARALVEVSAPDVLSVLADLFADKEWPVREAAAQCVGDYGSHAGVPLLRFKLRLGDDSPEVIGAAMGALLHLDNDGALELARDLLRSEDEVLRESVAIAVGDSRASGALDVLLDWWSSAHAADVRRLALVCIAMLRSRPAQAALLSIIETGDGLDARDAIAALAPYAVDPSVREALLEAAGKNEVSAVLRAAKEAVE